MAGVADGFITKESLWDRLVFDRLRSEVLGEAAGTLRGVIVAGGPYFPNSQSLRIDVLSYAGRLDASALTPARIVFSVPFVHAESSPLAAGPIFASHPFDLQMFASSGKFDGFSTIAPVGAPSINVEVKLAGVNDTEVQAGGDPVGELLVRGPPVGQWLGAEPQVDDAESEWMSTGYTAKVLSNGTFKIDS